MLESLLGWLGDVPLGALYALIFGASLVEGILPLMPGDVAAALLAFFAARAGGLLTPTIMAVTGGSILGALVMWWVGKRYGANWLTRQLHRFGLTKVEHQVEEAEHKVEAAYRQYGWVALFVSRFLPGLRAVVPVAAGALRIPFWEVTIIFTLASAIWYGTIAWIAFRVGDNWETVRDTVVRVGRDVGIGAIVAGVVLAIVGWRLIKRRRAAVKASGAASAAASAAADAARAPAPAPGPTPPDKPPA
jgi:membrane protein DedA with SNARE-associated domain